MCSFWRGSRLSAKLLFKLFYIFDLPLLENYHIYFVGNGIGSFGLKKCPIVSGTKFQLRNNKGSYFSHLFN